MANLKISDLTERTDHTGEEYAEVIVPPFTSGTNRKILTSKLGITREFNRTFSETVIFDKNEIFYAPFVMTEAIDFIIGSGLVDQSSAARLVITADGVSPINFGSGFNFLYGITNGQILEAGTYEMYFLYTNGSVSVNVPGVTSQSSGATVLSIPTGLAAVPGTDTETELDVSWNNVANESSFLVEFSTTGVGGWATLDTPAANVLTTTQTGLTVGVTRYYRVKAIGDGINFLNSDWSEVVSGQTTSASDTTDPTFVFTPLSGVTTWTVNKPIVITANEPVQNLDTTPITSNQAGIITLKQTNSGGADIAHTWTIDGTKTIFTITPTVQYGENQLVYWAINNIEDINANDVTVAVSSTFTTTDYTFFNGTSNRLAFGDILDSIISTNDTNFWLELTVKDLSLTGTRNFVSKSDQGANQRGFKWIQTNTDIIFAWWKAGTSSGGHRIIKWAGALTTGEHIFVLKYDGSIDTNDGLDRLTLLDNGGTVGSKTLDTGALVIGNIFDNTAQLTVGAAVNSAGNLVVGEGLMSGEAKDFIIRSTGGTVVEINVPNLTTGLDTSGNARHGTWV